MIYHQIVSSWNLSILICHGVLPPFWVVFNDFLLKDTKLRQLVTAVDWLMRNMYEHLTTQPVCIRSKWLAIFSLDILSILMHEYFDTKL